MTVLVVLLELVRRHIIPPNPASASIQYQDYSRVFYVSINATKLVFISSWSSSVAPTLLGFVMSLWSFPIARRMGKLSVSERPGVGGALPTPF